MAIDTVSKRASATFILSQSLGVWPAGATNRLAASWMYNGIAIGAAAAVVVVELFAALSEIFMTLANNSIVWTSKAGESEVITTLTAESNL